MGDKNSTYRQMGDGVKSVTTAGTRVQLSADSVPVRMVEIQARTGNTGNIAVGSSSCVAAAGSERGIILVPGASVQVRVSDLNKLYLDSTVSGEGVSFLYFYD